MADYPKLKALVLQSKYSAFDNATLAAELAIQRNRGPAEYTMRGMAQTLGAAIAGRLFASMDAASDSNPLVKWYRESLLNNHEFEVDLNNDDVRTMVDSFAANGQLPLTSADAATIKALADNRLSDAKAYGLDWQPTENDIKRVRA